MGCCYSRIEREETVSRCKARKRYMKQFVRARHAFSAAHAMYVRSLRGTGSSLLQFANIESSLHHRLRHANNQRHHLPPPLPSQPPRPQAPPPRPPAPASPSSVTTWTTDTASTATPRPPPPPPPPVLASSIWDFWDPFAPQAPPLPPATEEVWEETTVESEVAPPTEAPASVAPPPSVVSGFSKDTGSELAVVVSRNVKDLAQIITELDEYFLKAAKAGGEVSSLLEVPSSTSSTPISKVYNN